MPLLIFLHVNKQDHKTRSIEYSHATCLWIVQIHCIYVHVMGIFALFLFFSQVPTFSTAFICFGLSA